MNDEVWAWAGHVFQHAFTVVPEKGPDGGVLGFERWKTHSKAVAGEEPHGYGRGPFTDFGVPLTVSRKPGVYVFLIGEQVMYVGQSGKRSLRERLSDYHRIGGRQSFAKGPKTTCYVNARIYAHLCVGDEVRVHILETDDFDAIESTMIHDLGHPPWNLDWCDACGYKNNAQ